MRSPCHIGKMSWAALLRDILGLFRLEIVDPDVVGHAAAIAFPGAELAEDAVVGELVVVGRIRGEAAARQWQRLGQAALAAARV